MSSRIFGSKIPAVAHLVAGRGGVSGEVADLRSDIDEAFSALEALGVAGAGGYDVWTDVDAADTDAIKTSIASSASNQTYTGTALNGVVGAGQMDPPRNITITTTSNAHINAVGVVITGIDVTGAALSETITLTDNGGVTDVGNKAFSYVTQIYVPAQGGTGGSLEFGFGDKIGFTTPIKTLNGLTALTREIVNGVDLSEPVQVYWENLAQADPNGIKLSVATSTSNQTYSGTALDGVIGQGTISPPRNITVTSTSHANVDAVTVVVTGEDIYGNTITDSILLTDGGGTTDVGDVCFAKVTSIYVPLESGTGGAHEFGFGDVIGFPVPILFKNADPQVLSENEAGTPKTVDSLAGTYVAYSSSLPNGSVDPGSNANGTNDYFYVYLAQRGTVTTAAVGGPNGTYTPAPVATGKNDYVLLYPTGT